MKLLKIIQKILLPIFCVGLSTGLSSCSETENHRLLTSAEKIMQENPDSAKIILDKIDAAKLSGNKGEKALYALLRSQVKDKLYDYTTDDSLINIAVEYYNSPKKDPRHYMLSRYYLGRILYFGENKATGLSEFFKAVGIAEDLNDEYWKGLCYRGISDIFSHTYDSQEELYYARKEYEAFAKAKLQPYLNYSILDLCRALSSTSDFREVDSLSIALLDSAELYKDYYLKNGINQIIGLNAYRQGNYNTFIDAYTKVCSGEYAEYNDSIYLVLGYIANGDINNAYSVLDLLKPSDGLYDFAKYKFLLSQNDTIEAFKSLQKLYHEETSLFRKRMGQDMASSIHSLHSKEHLENLSEIKNLHYSIIIIILSLVLFLSTGFFVSYILIKKNKLKAIKLTQKLIALDELLKSKDIEIHNNENQTNILRSSLKKNIISKYEILDRCGKILYANPNSEIAQRKIYSEITKIFKSFSTNNNIFIELEEMANANFNQIMASLRMDLPGLKEIDYRLFLLSVFKFSYTVITMFLMNESIESLYQRKKRLKQKIKSLEQGNLYLSFLD